MSDPSVFPVPSTTPPAQSDQGGTVAASTSAAPSQEAAASPSEHFDFKAINESHNQPYPAIEWIHGDPILILNLAKYADLHYEHLSAKAGFDTISASDNLPWAQAYAAKHPAHDAQHLAQAMTIARQEAPFGAFPRELSFFNHQTFWSTIALLLVSAILLLFARRRIDQYKPANGIQNVLEATVLFVRDDIVRPNIPHGDHWTPYFASVFIALLACNLFGIIPFFATATGSIAVTAGFALVTLVLMLAMGLKENGPIKFWVNIIPVKWSWKPIDMFVFLLLLVLEWLSLLTRPAILAIRLFANMLAGHTVLLVFLSLGFIIHAAHGHQLMAHGLGVVGWLISIPFYALELLVAFIQAYIFTLLSAIFIGQCAHPEH